MRKSLLAAGLGFALLNAILWFSTPAIRQAVDASYGRLDAPSRPMIWLGVQELLVYYDPWLARIVFPMIFTVGFACIPFLLLFEPNSETALPAVSRPFITVALLLLCFLEAVWLFLIWVGVWCRGPNWMFYWPSETWDVTRLKALNYVNLSEYVWIDILRKNPLKLEWWIRELPGLLLIAIYFIGGGALTLLVHRKNPYLHRFLIVTLLFQIALLVPVKMTCRWLVDLKYFVAIPEYFFNI